MFQVCSVLRSIVDVPVTLGIGVEHVSLLDFWVGGVACFKMVMVYSTLFLSQCQKAIQCTENAFQLICLQMSSDHDNHGQMTKEVSASV